MDPSQEVAMAMILLVIVGIIGLALSALGQAEDQNMYEGTPRWWDDLNETGEEQ